MRRPVAAVLLLAAACTSEPGMIESTAAPLDPARLVENEIAAPDFVDFLAIDGDNAWVTNRGRVELWSKQGKLASVAMSRPCGTMAIASGSLWVANCEEASLYRVDLQSRTVDTIIPTGIAEPRGETNVVAGAGSVWVPSLAQGGIARVDPATNEVIATVEVVPGSFFLAYGRGALWAVSSERQLLQRIDPATNAVTGTVALGKQPGFLTAGDGGVWVQEQGDGTVARIDPATLEVLGRTKVGDNLLYGDIDVAGGIVWLRTTSDQTFVAIDAETGQIVTRAGPAVGSGAIRYTPDGIWTSAHDVESLSWWEAGPAGE